MPITDVYSKRQKKLRGEVPDVYVYDDLPRPLRIQITRAWRYSLKRQEGDSSAFDLLREVAQETVRILCDEYAVFELPGAGGPACRDMDDFSKLCRFFLREKDIEKALDPVEILLRVFDQRYRNEEHLTYSPPKQSPAILIEEINARFKEHGVGYQFSDGQIIRISSEFTHSEIVKPALQLLHDQSYSGAQEEFLKAHEHYRKGNFEEALVECHKAFESVMKVICEKRGWDCGEDPTVGKLIETCFKKKLIPKFLQSHYESLENLLKTGTPTIRNKLGAHGSGSTSPSVPDYLVAYTLHITASTIIFLVEAEKNLS